MIRGGIGLFAAPFQIQGVPGLSNAINQIGYSRNTPVPVTNDNGLTFQANLTNPIRASAAPAGRVGPGPVGDLGGSPGTMFGDERKNPTYWRYSIGVERELRATCVEVSYLGQTAGTCRSSSVNYVPEASRTQSVVRDAAAETLLTPTVTNPFQGLFPDNPGVNGARSHAGGCCWSTRSSTRLNWRRYRDEPLSRPAARLDKRFTTA